MMKTCFTALFGCLICAAAMLCACGSDPPAESSAKETTAVTAAKKTEKQEKTTTATTPGKVPASVALETQEQESWVCPSCGETNTGRFCRNCGQPHSDAQEETVISVNTPAATDSETTTTSGIGQDNRVPISDAELIRTAKNYYKMKNGYEPQNVEIDSRSGDTVSIHLYDMADDHTATLDWYYIDIYTGIGTNLTGETVNLNDASAQ